MRSARNQARTGAAQAGRVVATRDSKSMLFAFNVRRKRGVETRDLELSIEGTRDPQVRALRPR